MKKNILIILFTFIAAFATSLLYEIEFIDKNKVRQFLVLLLIIFELGLGYKLLKVNNSNTE